MYSMKDVRAVILSYVIESRFGWGDHRWDSKSDRRVRTSLQSIRANLYGSCVAKRDRELVSDTQNIADIEETMRNSSLIKAVIILGTRNDERNWDVHGNCIGEQ
ncbi:hypothetical protein AB6A40_004131 [Gnathostoma spinigerum]|uniref:Uncharacterized protein n=1 Tax=Gnathostoma spinigerum TaxID=75299 RepID=A0ABD6ELH1_9BILA